MSIVSALSKLLIKMGGTPATGDTSDELVDKIADSYTPGGGVLVVERIQGDENNYIDATAKELIDAIGEGKLVFLKHNDGGSGAPVNVYDMSFISNATQMTLTGMVSFVSISAFTNEVYSTTWIAATENDRPIANYPGEEPGSDDTGGEEHGSDDTGGK